MGDANRLQLVSRWVRRPWRELHARRVKLCVSVVGWMRSHWHYGGRCVAVSRWKRRALRPCITRQWALR